jgi:hypothetical protein
MKYFVKPIVLFIFLAGSAGVFPSDTLAKDVKEYMQKLRDGIVWMSASNDYCGTPSRQLKAVWEDLLNVTTISPERRREIMDGFETDRKKIYEKVRQIADSPPGQCSPKMTRQVAEGPADMLQSAAEMTNSMLELRARLEAEGIPLDSAPNKGKPGP